MSTPRTATLPTIARAALTALTTIGVVVVAESLIRLLRLAREAWLHPVLFHDSHALIRPGDRWGPGLLAWMLEQHNEHHIALQRLSSLIGEAWFGMPPGAGGVPANVLLLLAISGTLAWLCHQLIPSRQTALCLWSLCTLLAWNPWQWENILWEFQTPWFLISLLVLLSMAIQRQAGQGAGQLQLARLFGAVAPFVAILSSGQGLAAAVSMIGAAWANERLAARLTLISTAAGVVLISAVGYQKPSQHPALSFRVDYLFNILTNGLPDGRGLVLLVLLLLTIWFLGLSLRTQEMLILLQPTLFAVLFGLMTTIGRSGFGAGQALASRYSTYSVLILINLILLLISRTSEQPRLQGAILGVCLLLTVTVGDAFSNRWQDAYNGIQSDYEQRVKVTACAFRSRGRDCVSHEIWPFDGPGPTDLHQYLSGRYHLQGWHQRLIAP